MIVNETIKTEPKDTRPRDNSIADTHPEYQKREKQWERCRDFIAGKDALYEHDRSNGASEYAYIARLSDKQLTEEYNLYIRRALYDNTVRRIRNSLLGLVFAKEPIIEVPAGIRYFEDDADMMETPLAEFCESVASEILNVGRVGVLVDRPPSGEGVSRAEAELMGIRPYFAMYKAEAILNWEMKRIFNRWMINRVVLAESDKEIRELYLDESVQYHVNIWRKMKAKDKTDEWVLVETSTPLMNGNPINSIPFFFFGPQSGSVDTVEPPLLDVVDIAKSHYQSSADLEHARFACSVPTPFFFGFTGDEVDSLALGGLNGIHAMNTDAKCGFLEYTGQGTEPLERAMQQKFDMMARHSVDLLAGDKNAEAVGTVRMKVSVQTATLADMARSVSRLLTQALNLAAQWAGASGEAEITLNTEYTAEGISPQEITVLMQGVINNTLPIADFIRRLRKVGLIEADRTDEQVMADLALGEERDTGTLESNNGPGQDNNDE